MSSLVPSHSSALVHRRLLYDCSALKVKLVRGDTLPGPGFTAALTATDKVGAGDSHRGAVAAALVEALRSPDAANRDYSVAAEEGRPSSLVRKSGRTCLRRPTERERVCRAFLASWWPSGRLGLRTGVFLAS